MAHFEITFPLKKYFQMAYFQPSFRTKFYSNSMKGLIGFEVSNAQQPHYLQSKSLLAISFAAAAKGALCISGALLLVVKNAIKREFNFRWMDVTQTRISKTFKKKKKLKKGLEVQFPTKYKKRRSTLLYFVQFRLPIWDKSAIDYKNLLPLADYLLQSVCFCLKGKKVFSDCKKMHSIGL